MILSKFILKIVKLIFRQTWSILAIKTAGFTWFLPTLEKGSPKMQHLTKLAAHDLLFCPQMDLILQEKQIVENKSLPV